MNHEVLAPERIIGTFEFEGLPESGHVILDTARFEALPDNRTKVTSQSVFLSVEDRDGMLQSGMEEGMNHMNVSMSYWKRCKNREIIKMALRSLPQ